jgi:hypothetical protein
MPLNVTMSVGCGGTWLWGQQNLYDVGFANGEAVGVQVRSLLLEIDGIPGAVMGINDAYGVLQPSGAQDLDLAIPLPYSPPNPDVGQSYDLICKVISVVTKTDGTEATTLNGSCMCTVSHNG